MTKTILCFGDSNTHGKRPDTGKRYTFDNRWPGVVQNEFDKRGGDKVRVIEEGLNGRTTIYDEPLRVGRNGADYLPVLVESHSPLDMLVIMLGTNDVLMSSEVNVEDAAKGVSQLIDLARLTCNKLDYPLPTVLIVSPPTALTITDDMGWFCPGDPEKTHDFAMCYKQLAERKGCLYLDAAKYTVPSKLDGVHLDAENQRKLGVAIASFLKVHI